jgi:hypothetical protein
MNVSQAGQSFLDYHRMNSKKNTLRNYYGGKYFGMILPSLFP